MTPKISLEFHRIEYDTYFASRFHSTGEATHVLAVIDGERFPVYFFEPETLRNRIGELKAGMWSFALPNIIVVAEVTLEEMQFAVEKAYQRGFFKYLKSISQERLNSGDDDWYPCLPDGTWV